MLIDQNKLKQYLDGKVTGVYHVGGHHGQEHNFYESLNVDQVVYFEPHPDSFSVLESNLGNKEKVRLEKLALGESDNITKQMFCETSNQGMSNSLLKPAYHNEMYPHIVFDADSVEVEIMTLDKYVSENPFSARMNYLYMDVQGYELHVLKGSEKTLESVDYVMSEVNFSELYEGCSKFDEISEFLSERNFELKELESIRGHWGDALFEKVR